MSKTAALLLIEKEQFSLYIIDGEMPGVSGLGPCEEIRKRDPKTPIIIYSGHAYDSDREAGRLAGANVYLVKPDISEIVPTVKRLLEEARAANSERARLYHRRIVRQPAESWGKNLS